MCLPNILFPVFVFTFIFHCRSFSPSWPLAFLIFSPPLWISMFFFLRNSSPLFSVTRSSCFSVIHVCVNIKNNAEKDTTLLLFFLSNSPSRHVISFQIKPWVAFGLLYLLIELFYSGMPVMRTDGRCTVTWLPNFLGWVDYQISLAMEGILHAHACIRWTTIECGHQIWWRGIENWRKGTVLLKAISFVLWIPYFPTKNILHDKNRTFSTRVFLL